MAAVVMLVILRVTIGWHFLYEGVWKIVHADVFSARPFLTQAKGPAAPLFYAMVTDIDGRQRLEIRPVADGRPLKDAWKRAGDEAVKRYKANLEKRAQSTDKGKPPAEESLPQLRQFEVDVQRLLWQYEDRLDAYLADNVPRMAALVESLRSDPSSYDRIALLQEATGWLSDLKQIEDEYHGELLALFKKDAREGEPAPKLAVLVPEVKADTKASDVLGPEGLRAAADRPLALVEDGITGKSYLDAWKDLKEKVIAECRLSEEQAYEAEKTYRAYQESVREYLADNVQDIAGYFGNLERLQQRKTAGTNETAHEKKRIWDEQQKLRAEVNGWLSDLDGMGREYQSALWDILAEDQKEVGPIHAPVSTTEALPVSLPLVKTKGELLDLAVTYGLTAIGLCLVVGLCTRLAALGGAAFLIFVLLTQPPWPTIYPPAPQVVGHALIVDKNFVEMVALLLLASTAVGRWGGLDFFLYHCLGRPILSRFRSDKEQDEDR